MGKYEEKLKELKETVRKIEREDIDVEEAIQLYQKGEILVKECYALLEEAKERIKALDEEKDSG
jgi:exodeoxyribonuclease VII small subunit